MYIGYLKEYSDITILTEVNCCDGVDSCAKWLREKVKIVGVF